MDIEKKRGRPVQKQARDGKLTIRTTEEDRNRLTAIMVDTGKTKTEIISRALEIYYNGRDFL